MDSPATLIPIATLITCIVAGAAGLRRLPPAMRLAIDGVAFIAACAYFDHRQRMPIFPAPTGHMDGAAIWDRVIAGAWWVLAARLVVGTLSLFRERNQASHGARLFSDLAAAAIYLATATVILKSVFAIPITGVVATSGIVVIVVGLALQNTLADVFSGIAVGIEAPFGVGDRVQIGDHTEGLIVQINWRSVRVQTDSADVAIIPNSLVAKSEIINRSFPNAQRAAGVDISCPAHVPPEAVIQTLLQATLLCPAVMTSPAPTAVVARLGRRRTHYHLAFHASDTSELGRARDTLLRAAHRQMQFAGFLNNPSRDPAGKDAAPGLAGPINLLRGLPLFDCLTDQQIAVLAATSQPHRLEAEQALFAEGTTDARLYIVISGVLRVTRQTPDGPACIGAIGAGDYVGEIGLLTGDAHAASATAITDCRVHTLCHDDLIPLLTQNPELAAAFAQSVRRGLDILHRAVAKRASADIDGPGQLLARIRSFLTRTG